MPRRYHAYPEEWQVLNVLSSAGATVLGFGFLLPFVYLVVVDALGQAGVGKPLGRRRSRVGHSLAAADRKLPRRRRW